MSDVCDEPAPREPAVEDLEAVANDCRAFGLKASDPQLAARYFVMAERWSERAHLLASKLSPRGDGHQSETDCQRD